VTGKIIDSSPSTYTVVFKDGTERVVNKKDVELKPRDAWTCEDVCDYFIKPSTSYDRCMYSSMLPEKRMKGKPFVGSYLCYCQSAGSFCDVVDAIAFQFKGQSIFKTFIWWDLFCINFHFTDSTFYIADEKPKWKKRPGGKYEKSCVETDRLHMLNDLGAAIDKFDDMLVYAPNSSSLDLIFSHCWCNWEIFSCSNSIYWMFNEKPSREIVVDPIRVEDSRAYDPRIAASFTKQMNKFGVDEMNEAIRCKLEESLRSIASVSYRSHAWVDVDNEEAKEEANEVTIHISIDDPAVVETDYFQYENILPKMHESRKYCSTFKDDVNRRSLKELRDQFFEMCGDLVATRRRLDFLWSKLPAFGLLEIPSLVLEESHIWQLNLHGDPVKNLDQLYESATSMKHLFESKMSSIFEGSELQLCTNLKSREKAARKVQENVWTKTNIPVALIVDIIRCSVICADCPSLLKSFQKLQNSCNGGFKIVGIKNRFKNPTLAGYRDLLVLVRIKLKRCFHTAEIQFHLAEFKQMDPYGFYLFSSAIYIPPSIGSPIKFEVLERFAGCTSDSFTDYLMQDLAKRDKDNMISIALLLRLMNERDHEFVVLESILDFCDENSFWFCRLAMLYMELNNFEEALPLLKQGIKWIDPRDQYRLLYDSQVLHAYEDMASFLYDEVRFRHFLTIQFLNIYVEHDSRSACLVGDR